MMRTPLLFGLYALLLHVHISITHQSESDDDDAVCESTSSNTAGILDNPSQNLGLSFPLAKRKQLNIDGLLPAGYRPLSLQRDRVMHELRQLNSNLEKYRFLMHLLASNANLFHSTLSSHLTELMPIVYTPTVGAACQQLGYVLSNYNHGIWLSITDTRSDIMRKLEQWPQRSDIRGIVVTDGERILGLGDLGAFGMGIPIGKLALYSAIGGIPSSQLLPVMLDVGTNNAQMRNDPLYFGLRQSRTAFTAQQYDTFVDDFMRSVVRVFGKSTLVQFEDFGNKNAFRLLRKYDADYCMFNDDIQGTAAVTLAGIYAAVRAPQGLRELKQHRFVLVGAGSAGIGIAGMIAQAVVKESGMSWESARRNIWLVDSRGLIFEGRASGGISVLKALYAHKRDGEGLEGVFDIEAIVRQVGATAIIGVSGQAGIFTQGVMLALKENERYPIVFCLSNPTSMSECTAQDAYDAMDNELFFASGSPFMLTNATFGDVDEDMHASQGNNAYIFPGVALAVIASEAMHVPGELFLVAAETLASIATDNVRYGMVYPPIEKIQEVSVEIAVAVVEEIYKLGLTHQDKVHDIRALVTRAQYHQ